MKKGNGKTGACLPKARQEGLEVQELADELLVYDLERHRAYQFNRLASLAWKHCNGRTGYSEAASRLQADLGVKVDQELVRLVVRRLRDLRLVEGESRGKGYSRRDLIKKLRKLGLAAAAMLPLVTSIVAPTPAKALSCVEPQDCATVPNCTPCNRGGCTWMCCGGLCLPPSAASNQCGC